MTYLGNSYDPGSPTVEAADQACRRYAAGLATQVSAGVAAEMLTRQLEYARCMRSHGITTFPDPSPNGGFPIGSRSGIDPGSPIYDLAQKACQGSTFPPLGPPGDDGS
ncbi:MAG TPA: hypothetical protein VMD59_21575 [Acidimicrobiales bacterium]|nr:hypothetical protein [Acidimicrobiales bacterium]